MLGETLTCYVRLINLADAALTNIAVKASWLRHNMSKVFCCTQHARGVGCAIRF